MCVIQSVYIVTLLMSALSPCVFHSRKCLAPPHFPAALHRLLFPQCIYTHSFLESLQVPHLSFLIVSFCVSLSAFCCIVILLFPVCLVLSAQSVFMSSLCAIYLTRSSWSSVLVPSKSCLLFPTICFPLVWCMLYLFSFYDLYPSSVS